MVKERTFSFIGDQVAVLAEKMFPLYLVMGEKNFLIDGAVTARIKDISGKIAGIFQTERPWRSRTIDTILLTHTHYDHTGGCTYLQELYGCDIRASQKGAELLVKDKVIETIQKLNRDYEAMFKVDSGLQFQPLKNLSGLAEGDRIPVDETHYLEVFDTPGHTKCSISFFLHPEQVLFPGDSVGIMMRKGVVRPLFLSSYREYEDSIRKLQALGAHTLAFAHNQYLTGKDRVKDHLQAALDSTRLSRDQILAQLEKSPEPEKIAEYILAHEPALPRVMGTRETFMINLTAMVKAVQKDFC